MTNGTLAPRAPLSQTRADEHIVDVLIEERCAQLRASPAWPLLRAALYPILKKKQAERMADAIAPLPGRDAFDYMSALLSLDVVASGLEHVPQTGRVIIASTHPTGIADGIAMYDALKAMRPDLVFFANRDAIRVAPRFSEMLIPVEWVEAKRTRARSRETLAGTVKAFTHDRCVVLFPSGRLARRNDDGSLSEQPWQTSVALFARKYDCPIVPVHMTARNSWLYYWFWKINTELRDITLFHELLNKRGKRYALRFGAPIAPGDLPDDARLATEALRLHASHGVPANEAFSALNDR